MAKRPRAPNSPIPLVVVPTDTLAEIEAQRAKGMIPTRKRGPKPKNEIVLSDGTKATRKPDSTRMHTSFYAEKAVFDALKQIALKRECRVHDLLTEGVRLLFVAEGRNDFDVLNISPNDR